MTTKRKSPRARALIASLTRRQAFAAAFVRLGTASAAFREICPRAATWKAESVASEASKLRHDPRVAADIARLQNDARLDAIASRQEIAAYLAAIMRGDAKETHAVKVRDEKGNEVASTVEVPAAIAQRINAARQLHRMLPEVEPPKPEQAEAQDDASVCLTDRLAALRKKRHEKPL